MKKIKVVKDGPYIVTGKVPLSKQNVVTKSGVKVYELVEKYPEEEEYVLCRCGYSKNKPYCDGEHKKNNFDGTETVPIEAYLERAEYIKGKVVNLYDDDNCAFARFCHREHGSVWDLVENAGTDELVREAIEGASLCPTGRLTIIDNKGEMYEYEYDPEIIITDDKGRRVASGIHVRGNIPIENADGEVYEVRNRSALCRCGASKEKPLCDAAHVRIEFDDN